MNTLLITPFAVLGKGQGPKEPLIKARQEQGDTAGTPAGQPQAARERLPVPGAPRAQTNRPAVSPGRIPVPMELPSIVSAPSVATPPIATTETLDQGDVSTLENELDYLLIRSYLKSLSIEDTAKPFKASDLQAPASAGSDAVTPAGSAFAGDTVDVEYVRYEAESVEINIREGGSDVSINMSRVSFERVAIRSTHQTLRQTGRSDPLILDLNGNGIETTGVDKGVSFDINADGRMDKTSFVSGGDAFLALDRNGNGVIDDGSELFGDQNGDANGFLALARLDDNADNRIDSNDRAFSELRLLSLDAMGRQQTRSLGDAGIAAIQLAYQDSQQALNRYDSLSQVSRYLRDDGSSGTVADALLGYQAIA